MAQKTIPLTDEQIRREFQTRKEKDFELALDFLTLQEALFAKGLLTPEDMAAATRKVAQQQKEALARVGEAMKKKPPESLQ